MCWAAVVFFSGIPHPYLLGVRRPAIFTGVPVMSNTRRRHLPQDVERRSKDFIVIERIGVYWLSFVVLFSQGVALGWFELTSLASRKTDPNRTLNVPVARDPETVSSPPSSPSIAKTFAKLG
jgi:hypothetical protein